MKRFLAVLAGVLAVAGCAHGQIPPNPTVYICPATTGTAYTALNQTTPATGLSYTDTTPAAGQYCYIAQSVVSSTSQVSVPSNTAGPLNVTTGKSVLLTWQAPTTGPTPTGYVISRAPAIASTLGAPALSSGSLASNSLPATVNFHRELNGQSTSALVIDLNVPAKLNGRLQ